MRKASSKQGSKPKSSQGFIRIISGLWRGRKLPVFDAEGLRPTTDRVKETLFNWIAQDVGHAKCLDLFAGSGGLGFECASRQADSVLLIEKNPQAYKQLNTNIATLKANNIKVLNQDALSFLDTTPTEFDLVFLDPPFHQGLLDEALVKLEQNGWLAPEAKIYIETEKSLTQINLPSHWQLLREKTAGQVCYRLYQKEEV